MTTARGPASSSLKAVSRTMQILEALTRFPDGLSVGELSREVSVEKSVASRIVATLVRHGYVRANGQTSRFIPAFKFLTLSYRFAWAQGFPALFLPALSELTEASGETSQLAAVEGGALYFVARATTRRAVILPPQRRAFPLHASAFGRAWLSTLPEREAARVLGTQPLERLTSSTCVRLEELRERLRLAREAGYALVEGEFMEGLSAVAAPIFASPRAAVAAVGVVGPSTRLGSARADDLGATVKRVAGEMGRLWPLVPEASASSAQVSG